jgi:hypothetical protein
MDNWLVTLLVKGVAAVLIGAAYYVFVYRGSHFIGRFIKNPKLHDFLFRERWHEDSGRSAALRQSRKNKL